MVNLPPLAVDHLAEFTDLIIANSPVVGNVAICSDSLCTTGKAGINFYYLPNPLERTCFATSCVFGLLGATTSGTALATSACGIQITGSGWIGSIGSRSLNLNKLGKYAYHMGNSTPIARTLILLRKSPLELKYIRNTCTNPN